MSINPNIFLAFYEDMVNLYKFLLGYKYFIAFILFLFIIVISMKPDDGDDAY